MGRSRTSPAAETGPDEQMQQASRDAHAIAQMRRVADTPDMSLSTRFQELGRLRWEQRHARQSQGQKQVMSEAQLRRRIRFRTWSLRWVARWRLLPIISKLERQLIGVRCRLQMSITSDAFVQGWPCERVVLALSWDDPLDSLTPFDSGSGNGQILQLTLDGDLLVRIYVGGRPQVQGRVSLHHPQWQQELGRMIGQLFVPLAGFHEEQ